ncbi:MAG: hypothetical protein ACE5NC_01510 [Anaerolineae bacterium]
MSTASRPAIIDFTADVKAVQGVPMAKRGRNPGPTDNPHLREVEV